LWPLQGDCSFRYFPPVYCIAAWTDQKMIHFGVPDRPANVDKRPRHVASWGRMARASFMR
jgi:hypothetical protein